MTHITLFSIVIDCSDNCLQLSVCAETRFGACRFFMNGTHWLQIQLLILDILSLLLSTDEIVILKNIFVISNMITPVSFNLA